MFEHNSPFSAIKHLSPASHEQLHLAVRELSEKAGIEMPKLVSVNPKMLSNDMTSIMLKAAPAGTFMHAGKHHIFFNEDLIRIWDMPSLQSKVSNELKAVIAHEFGHIKRGDTTGLGSARVAQFTPLACVIAGLGVVAFLRNKPKATEGEHSTLAAKESNEVVKSSPLMRAVNTVGQYLLGAVTGLGIGIGFATFLRHRMEYSCDAFSKSLMGSGEPLISALQKFQAHSKSILQQALSEGKIEPRQAEKLESFFSLIERLFHPSVEKRAATLRSS